MTADHYLPELKYGGGLCHHKHVFVEDESRLEELYRVDDWEDQMIDRIDEQKNKRQPTAAELWEDILPALIQKYVSKKLLVYVNARFFPTNPYATVPVPYRDMTPATGKSVRWNMVQVHKALEEIKEGLKKDHPDLHAVFAAQSVI